VPTTRRTRTLTADPPAVWRTVADPNHQPRWWPLVTRVEGVEPDAFTQLLRTSKGRSIRADFVVLQRDEPAVYRIEQQLAGSPFERILHRNELTIELQPEGEAATLVVLTRQTKLRGMSALGGFMWRRAAAKQLDEALDALQEIHG
jgi:uncharacterized protein YndB with AHSA1/START domain